MFPLRPAPRPRRARAWVALALGLAVAAGAGDALSYCRSTTCSGDCPRDDDGCKTTGHALYWPGLCVGFSLQKDGTANLPIDQVRLALQRSFVEWSEVPCLDGGTSSLAFSELHDAACHATEYNEDAGNANIILFQDNRWDYHSADNTLAKTTVTYDTDTGEIFDADIEINHAYNEFTVGDDAVVYDLESVLTHEIGHFVGLDHSPDFDATMNAAYEPGDTSQRSLADDDVRGLCAVYPPSRTGTCDPSPRRGFASACGGAAEAADAAGCSAAPVSPRGSGTGFSWLVGAGALWLARRRKGRCAG